MCGAMEFSGNGSLEHITVDEIRALLMDHRAYNNASTLFNFSLGKVLDILQEKQGADSNVSARAEVALIIVYSLLIVIGLVANLLVSFVVARRQQMHTARNLYIVNLTISDITLCLVCMPFTLITILRRQWTLGSVLCKLVPMLQGTNIMVSIGTITVIALDRYFTIVRRSREDVRSNRRRVVVSIALVWLLSALAAAPMCFFQVVEPVTLPFELGLNQNVVLYEVCIEHWPSRNAQLLYTVCVLLLQSVLPAIVVATVHARIAAYLHAHARTQRDSRRARKELQRNRRTTLLLSGIAILFTISWLPQGIYSPLTDICVTPNAPTQEEGLYLATAVCHAIAMTSAVSNPIVYGWLNSNIRKEFLQLLPAGCVSSLRRDNRSTTTVFPQIHEASKSIDKTLPPGNLPQRTGSYRYSISYRLGRKEAGATLTEQGGAVEDMTTRTQLNNHSCVAPHRESVDLQSMANKEKNPSAEHIIQISTISTF
ncbi:neuropeptide Y receptor type 2 [Anabrus simplex]|uniref:neuropeptide Y receptor type 2 n=1 Tax=Anabrus simplex TaxID=316456 RepID=UPI0035A31839